MPLTLYPTDLQSTKEPGFFFLFKKNILLKKNRFSHKSWQWTDIIQ